MRRRVADESGFTLIELITVIMIIGILTAIALPLFMGQSAKARDAEAKSDARSMVGAIEACFVETGTYDPCPGPDTGLSVGTGPGQVEAAPSGDTYVVVAHSRSGNSFSVEKAIGGVVSRTCTSDGAPRGGCHAGSW